MISEFFIPAAMAEEGGLFGGGFLGPDLFIIVAFGLVFYFIIWRPQSKRAKEHKDLITSLNKGDEIVTSGGLIGKIVELAGLLQATTREFAGLIEARANQLEAEGGAG